MKIIYCHHAQRKKGEISTQQDDLTEFGIKDAKLTAELFEMINNFETAKHNVKIEAIYTSPFFRCKKTANIINERIKVKVFEEPRLNEFGSFKNETWVDCQNRIIDALNDISSKHSSDSIVICVTSGINIAGFICWSFNLEPNSQIPFLGISSCSPICFEKK